MLADSPLGFGSPLGWDLEWETWTWNADYTDKEVGKAALFQIGDKNNIVLFQIQRGSSEFTPPTAHLQHRKHRYGPQL
jgi:hypothetical protein